MCIPDGGDGPLCGDCLLLWMEGAPAVGRHETDSNELDHDMPSLVDGSSDEGERQLNEAGSGAKSASSEDEL